MTEKQYGKRIFHALEGIDPELLFDARAYRAPRIRPFLLPAAAAVVALAVLSVILILSAANAVKTYFTVDTNYGVTLELNGDHRVVKATASASPYASSPKQCRGLNAETAARQLIDVMTERGGLSKSANTILFGITDESAAVIEPVIASAKDHGSCVIRAVIDDEVAAQMLAKKRHITAGKAALLLSLSRAENGIKETLLFRLSANDIALLATAHRLQAEGVTVSGKPLDTGLLPAENIKQIALKSYGSSPKEIVCRLDSDGFKLVYTVLLYEGNHGAAYVIGASSGEIQKEIHGASTTLHQQLERVREEFSAASDSAPLVQTAPVIAEPSQTLMSELPAPTAAPSPPTEALTISPTVTPTVIPEPTASEEPTVSPTQEEPAPYLSAQFITAYPGFFEGDIPLTGTASGNREHYFPDPAYSDHNPNAALIRSHVELHAYAANHPNFDLDRYDAFYPDEFFEDHALILATATEHYDNSYLHYWYAYIHEDILYLWDRDLQLEITPDNPKIFEPPLSVTFRLALNRNLSDIQKIRIIQPTGDQFKELEQHTEALG